MEVELMNNEKINEYILKQKSPQKEICQILREIIFDTFPSINEEMKYGVPYFGNKFYIVALKTHVNLGFSIEGLTKEEIGLFDGSGKTTRHVKIKWRHSYFDSLAQIGAPVSRRMATISAFTLFGISAAWEIDTYLNVVRSKGILSFRLRGSKNKMRLYFLFMF